MPRDEATIGTMSPADIALAVDWAAAEGWNPGLADAACFREADPAGFLMLREGGEPAASISVVRYPDNFAFLGLYIVRPERRGLGLGWRLWGAGMARLDGCTVGLDGVVAQQANYARSGFAMAHRTIRFSGVPHPPGGADPRIVPFREDHRSTLAAFDRRHFPSRRDAFLRAWLGSEGHRTLIAVEDGAVEGYGVVRRCREGHKVGPLFARDRGIAAGLIGGLVEGLDGPVALDVPEPNGEAAALAQAAGLAPVFETARMYRGTPPDLPLGRVFGVTTLELG